MVTQNTPRIQVCLVINFKFATAVNLNITKQYTDFNIHVRSITELPSSKSTTMYPVRSSWAYMT